ncbi:uncharacterized protein LOC144149875 [Haemaphysalis longicornis]
MWRIAFLFAAFFWHAKAGIVDNAPANSLNAIERALLEESHRSHTSQPDLCRVPSEQIDRAVAALLSKVPPKYTMKNERDAELFTEIFISPPSLDGMNRLKVLKPYDVYCNNSNGNQKTMVNVEFVLDDPLALFSEWRYCESQKGNIGTTILFGRFTVVFEVEQRSEGQGILLRPKELHPVWMEHIIARLNGLGTTISQVTPVLGMLFPEFVRIFWVNIFPLMGMNALLVAAENM